MRCLAVLFAVVAVVGFANEASAGKKNPFGAILGHDDLHDDVQRAGGDVPSRLFRPAGAGGGFDDVGDRPGPEPRFQCDVEHLVRHELLDDAACLSNRLFS